MLTNLLSVCILIDSLGRNKFTYQWRLLEKRRIKGQVQEEFITYVLLNGAARHVIFSVKVLSPFILLLLYPLSVPFQG